MDNHDDECTPFLKASCYKYKCTVPQDRRQLASLLDGHWESCTGITPWNKAWPCCLMWCPAANFQAKMQRCVVAVIMAAVTSLLLMLWHWYLPGTRRKHVNARLGTWCCSGRDPLLSTGCSTWSCTKCRSRCAKTAWLIRCGTTLGS